MAIKGIGGVGSKVKNEIFALSGSTNSLLSDAFYRSQISLFVAKWWLVEVEKVYQKYRKSPFKKKTYLFKLQNVKK